MEVLFTLRDMGFLLDYTNLIYKDQGKVELPGVGKTWNQGSKGQGDSSIYDGLLDHFGPTS